MPRIDVIRSSNVSWEEISGLLCRALEGGSNYWYLITDHNFSEIKKENHQEDLFLSTFVALVDGGYFFIKDNESDDDPVKVDRAALEKGLKIMAEKYPDHFNDFLDENDDAETGDVFLQCVVFGSVILG